MIGPFENFSELGITDRYFISPPLLPTLETIDRERAAAFKQHNNLQRQKYELIGKRLIVPKVENRNGNLFYVYKDGLIVRGELERTRLYTLATVDEVLAGVRAHIGRIAELGPGRVWFLDEPAHIITDDGLAAAARRENDPAEYVVQRTLYGHENQIRWVGEESLP